MFTVFGLDLILLSMFFSLNVPALEAELDWFYHDDVMTTKHRPLPFRVRTNRNETIKTLHTTETG